MVSRNSSAPPPAVAALGPRGWAAAALLALATGAAYARTFSDPFEFDDTFAIIRNATIRHWSTAFLPPINTTASARPVLNLSLAINYAIGGLAVGSYHAFNLAIHLLAGLTLFGLVRRTLARAFPPLPALPLAFIASLLWLLHPLQTEAVTYVVQRAESLMGLFYLLTLYGVVRAAATAGRARRVWSGLAIAACALGMGTKEVMVSAPVIVLLYDRTFLAGSFRAAIRQRGRIYAGLAATWIMLPFLQASAHGRAGTAGFGSGVSMGQYLPTQFPAIANYLRLSFWPRPLIFDYGTQWVTDVWSVWPSALIVAGLLGATLWALRQQAVSWRSLGFAGIWFFAILAPSSLVPGNRQTAAEHRMYLALAPEFVLAVVGLHRWLGRAGLICGFGFAAALFGVTWQRNLVYRSALSLWSDTVAKNPGNPWAQNNIGWALQPLPGRLSEAIAHYQISLRLKPDYAEAHSNLGSAWMTLPGHLAEATAECETAVRLDPTLAEAHNNLGEAWAARPDRLADAIAQYEWALRLNPESAEAHNNLGDAWLKIPGKWNDAVAQFEAALKLNPESAEIHNNLGSAWVKAPDRQADAIAEFKTAIQLQPDFAQAYNGLGSALARMPGKLVDAIGLFQTAVRLDPHLAAAHYNLGVAWGSQPGKAGDAIAEYEAALVDQPDLAEAHYNLGLIWAARPGREAEAAAEYAAAARDRPDFAEAHNNLGAAWLRLPGRLNDAIGQLETAVRLRPDYPVFQLNLAVALLQAGSRTAEAREHLQAVLRLQPGNETARQILAKLPADAPSAAR